MSLSKGFSAAEVWLRLLEEAAQSDQVVSPRGMKTYELPWMQIELRDPMTFPMDVNGREFRNVIGVLEGLSLVGEFNIPELFTDRVAKFAQFMDDGVLWGAYGQRAHGSFGNLVDILSRDLESRQAVVTFFDHNRDLNRHKLDIPCTISGQFLIRSHVDGPEPDDVHNYLDLGISMRSNDLWLGTPYDFMQFAIWQASVAQAMGVRVGRYIHRVGSLHLYDRDVPKISDLSFASAVPMAFPLWGARSVAAIQERARQLALGNLTPRTQFEAWANDLLRG